MSSAALHLNPVWHPHSERLSCEVGQLAARLLAVLRTLPAAQQELASACAFLDSLVEAAPRAVPQHPWRAPHPLDRLAEAYSFTDLDRQLLLLAGLPHEHEGLSSICATLHPAGDLHPTVGMAAQLFASGEPARRELRAHLEGGAAVRSGALQVIGTGPLFNRSLDIPSELWSVLHGIDAWPAGLAIDRSAVVVAGLEQWLREPAVARAIAAIAAGARVTIWLRGCEIASLLQRGALLATAAETESVRLSAHTDAPELQLQLALHAVARGALPIVALPTRDARAPLLHSALLDFPGPLILCSDAGQDLQFQRRSLLEVAVARLSPSSRVAMWRQLLSELSGDAESLSMAYTVEPAAAAGLAADARTLAALEQRPVRVEDVAVSVRARGSVGTAAGVALRRATAQWSQLVLQPDRLAQLREAIDRLRHQLRVLDEWNFLHGRSGARGVRMLFAGPPGTGKTLAAEVLANTLGVDLLVVDLSKIVSKWLGETEKHLSEVFDVAERSQAVLLFDEADALFGRRTEVSDAHDRYANLETAYLLTRLERFEGLTVLSTNLQRNLDPAFMRRLEFIIEFDEPGPRERADLWRCHLAAKAPLASDVEVQELASLYPVVGGVIRNATIAAAFQAASLKTPITRALIVRALRREYQKSGRAFPGLPPGMAES